MGKPYYDPETHEMIFDENFFGKKKKVDSKWVDMGNPDRQRRPVLFEVIT